MNKFFLRTFTSKCNANCFRAALERNDLKKIFKFLKAGFNPNYVYQVLQLRDDWEGLYYECMDQTPLDMVYDEQVVRLLKAYGGLRSKDYFETQAGKDFLRIRKETTEAKRLKAFQTREKQLDKLLKKRTKKRFLI